MKFTCEKNGWSAPLRRLPYRRKCIAPFRRSKESAIIAGVNAYASSYNLKVGITILR